MLLLTRLPKWLQDVFAQPQCLHQNIGHALRKLVHARPPPLRCEGAKPNSAIN